MSVESLSDRYHGPHRDYIFVLPDGRKLGYTEYGDFLGRPVFYFHGGLSSRTDIAFGSAICLAQGVRLISIDRPGIGNSTYQPKRLLLHWPDDILKLAEHLRLKSFSVMGWSGGGIYAIACAFSLPKLVEKAITISGMCPLVNDARVSDLGLRADRLLFPLVHRFPLIARMALNITRLRSQASLKLEFLRDVSSPADRLVLKRMSTADLIDPMAKALKPGSIGTVRDYIIMSSPWGFPLSAVTRPCEVWQGSEDTLLPEKHARTLANGLPNSRFHLVPNAGHFLMRDNLAVVLASTLR